MAAPATSDLTSSGPGDVRRRPWLAPLGVGLAGLIGCAVVGLSDAASSVLPPCPFRTLTGWDCPGCGMTRGLRQLARLHVARALDFNVLLGVFVPFVAYLYVAWVAASLGPRLPRPAVGRRSGALLCGLLLAFAVVRNLPFGVGRYLNSGC
jgi:hypothetical protein